jgi:hypothetical protein
VTRYTRVFITGIRAIDRAYGGANAFCGLGNGDVVVGGFGHLLPTTTTSSRTITYGNISPTIVIGDTGGRSDDYILGLVEWGIFKALEQAAS